MRHSVGGIEKKKEPSICSSRTHCLDKTMTHSDTFLWHWQRSNARDKPWRHNKVTQNHLESLHKVFLLPVMSWFPIWEHMIQHCLKMWSMFTTVRRWFSGEVKCYSAYKCSYTELGRYSEHYKYVVMPSKIWDWIFELDWATPSNTTEDSNLSQWQCQKRHVLICLFLIQNSCLKNIK